MVIRGVVEEMENNSSAPLYPSLSHQFFVPHFSPLTIITFDVSMFHCTVYSHFVKCVWRERTTGNVCLIHFFLAFCFKFYSFPWKDFDISPLVPPNMFLFRLHRIKKKSNKKEKFTVSLENFSVSHLSLDFPCRVVLCSSLELCDIYSSYYYSPVCPVLFPLCSLDNIFLFEFFS